MIQNLRLPLLSHQCSILSIPHLWEVILGLISHVGQGEYLQYDEQALYLIWKKIHIQDMRDTPSTNHQLGSFY